MRTLGLAAGIAFLLAGAALHAATGHGQGLLLVGVLVVVSALVERRYRSKSTEERLDQRWQRSDERFIDPESGKAMEVWFDDLTGERRYVPTEVSAEAIR